MNDKISQIDRRAAEDVFAERTRQITGEGFAPERDFREYENGELAQAAACYAAPHFDSHPIPRDWPWAPEWWKPGSYRRNLVKAGALILADIARHDRAVANPKTLDQADREREVTLLNEIDAELGRARAKFPGKNVTFAALVEEVGELATATFEEPRANVRKEAVQVAVMAIRMVLDGDHTFDDWRASKNLDPLTNGEPK